MRRTKILSYRFNLALGFLPVLVCYGVSAFASHEVAIHAGAAFGVVLSVVASLGRMRRFPYFLLYSTTLMLALLSLTHVLTVCGAPAGLHLLAIEIAVLLPVVLLYVNRKRFLRLCNRPMVRLRNPICAQSAEATIVTVRVALLMGGGHLLLTLLLYLLFRPMGETMEFLLLQAGPPVVFLLTMVLNGVCIGYFNRVMRDEEFLPIVNRRGEVIGKCLKEDALHRRRDFILPVIRVAVSVQGLLFLAPRKDCLISEEGKRDLAVEGYPLYGEPLDEAVHRLLNQQLPGVPHEGLRFNLRYAFDNSATHRLVYLFTLPLAEDTLPIGRKEEGGKLWTFRQIAQNLHKNYFSSCFEYEYEELKTVIYTIEKYRES